MTTKKYDKWTDERVTLEEADFLLMCVAREEERKAAPDYALLKRIFIRRSGLRLQRMQAVLRAR